MLTTYLMSWYNDVPPDLYSEELLRQEQLSGDFILEGILSISWQEAHERYLLQGNKQGSSLRWTAALIIKLWDIAWDLWSYRNDVEHKHDKDKEWERVNSLITQQILQGFADLQDHSHLFSRQQLDAVHASDSLNYKRVLAAQFVSCTTICFSYLSAGLTTNAIHNAAVPRPASHGHQLIIHWVNSKGTVHKNNTYIWK
jgi:hypothetical protein